MKSLLFDDVKGLMRYEDKFNNSTGISYIGIPFLKSLVGTCPAVIIDHYVKDPQAKKNHLGQTSTCRKSENKATAE